MGQNRGVSIKFAMTAVGQTRKSGDAIATSALPPTTDIPASGCDVRKVPLTEVAPLLFVDHLVRTCPTNCGKTLGMPTAGGAPLIYIKLPNRCRGYDGGC